MSESLCIIYADRSPRATDHHLRKDVLLGNPEDAKTAPPPPPRVESADAAIVGVNESSRQKSNLPLMARKAVALGGRADMLLDGQDVAPIDLRLNFDALAVWSPSVRTDSNGRATVDVKLPDNLSRYRITAVTVDQGKRFGKTESNITAKKPLMVRPSAPRFMNFGDRIDLPVVVQNQTDQDMAVDIAVRATNALLSEQTAEAGGSTRSAGRTDAMNDPLQPSATADGSDRTGMRVLVKANGREEVRFPVSTHKAGTARFQIAVSSGKHTDAAEISLPVWTPATTEAFATYGSTDQN